jgi:hypothetical protein
MSLGSFARLHKVTRAVPSGETPSTCKLPHQCLTESQSVMRCVAYYRGTPLIFSRISIDNNRADQGTQSRPALIWTVFDLRPFRALAKCFVVHETLNLYLDVVTETNALKESKQLTIDCKRCRGLIPAPKVWHSRHQTSLGTSTPHCA